MTDWILELCRHAGVSSEYFDLNGRPVRTSREIQIGLLGALGFDIGSDDEARIQLEHLQREFDRRPAPEEEIVLAGKPSEVRISDPVDWMLEAETTGSVLACGSAVETIHLPALPMGIHRLVMSAGGKDWETWVLARPARAVSLFDLTKNARTWGISAALYGMTDGGSAAIGTYELLGKYAAAMEGHGADFLGINPVHAMGRTRPGNVISPYSPSHREFLNTWHVVGPDPSLAAENHGRANRGLIDYSAALAANGRDLAAGFERFRGLPANTAAIRAFEQFAQNIGEPLHDYALFEALANRYGPDWRNWPSGYRNRNPVVLAAFTQKCEAELYFHKWAQWQADCQLGNAQARAVSAGMGIGLYLDLAVGPRVGGAENWVGGSPLVQGATLGVPPDQFCPEGQNWGLVPRSPRICRDRGYAGFARLLRTTMRHAGMIRIDHVLGLMRSYWIPDGAEEGAYVSYPLDALLAVVAIESVRCRTIVVGEDLGLVSAGFREKLEAAGIYGLDVQQFQWGRNRGFEDTSRSRAKAICAFATHDTPTITGFFTAEDARHQAKLGLLDDVGLDRIRTERRAARRSLGDTPAVIEIHRRLARARSEMVAVQLDDMAGQKSQQNLPGTIDGYPNWRRSTPFSADEIRNSPSFAQLGSEMRAQCRGKIDTTEKQHENEAGQNHAH